MKKKLVVLSGAGMSKESGISTFRDMGGLWEQHDVMEVATFEAWQRNPEFVQRFYNDRRKQLLECEPNDGHRILAALESDFDVHIVTQNVDDLHERAGSTHVMHLHGELKKSRSTVDEHLVYPIDGWELKMGDLCENGSQLRPHIVWFGEAVPQFTQAAELVQQADILLVVGTSLNVYPAAGLIHYSRSKVPVYLVDPEPAEVPKHVHIIAQPATIGLAQFAKTITSPAVK